MQPMTIPEMTRASMTSRSCRLAGAAGSVAEAVRANVPRAGAPRAWRAGAASEVGLADRRAALDLARRAVGDDAAPVHDGDRVAQRADAAHVVVDEQDAAPRAADLVDERAESLR